MAGYWQREKETAQAIRDGWLYTGDAAYMDKDGFIFLKDRLKDMIVLPAARTSIRPRSRPY